MPRSKIHFLTLSTQSQFLIYQVSLQEAKITQIVPGPLFATPTLQEALDKMMSKITQMENTMAQMQANTPVLNLQYL